MWLALYPNMDEENFINFEDYKAKVLGVKPLTDKSDEEILKEALVVRKSLGGGKGGNI